MEERKEQRVSSSSEEETVAALRGRREDSIIHAIEALTLWLGAIHFIFALVLKAFLFLSVPVALTIFGLLLVFTVIPVNDKCKFGRKLSRYICENGCSYFRVTLHVEDINAFDPNHMPMVSCLSQELNSSPLVLMYGLGWVLHQQRRKFLPPYWDLVIVAS
ncbi:diacylglycerol O-acyltransferase 2D [Vitis vinifera]|uniref:diacylglycerol O-acyltransferase 2D n=1 Tax=Vitis vinifera TaxID=29760 RepID=UPI00053F637F|nr:diacylglycerol O-acyltransferase 2D [Vitis vinifera]XP_019075035.1 diacylglycerol O-acyltransferase 2D [Vitis vinifera]|eukprot:XP_010649322.1 PREDICTED: diacylglycerol O-acyltransferase 2-like [Vitis vinifera]